MVQLCFFVPPWWIFALTRIVFFLRTVPVQPWFFFITISENMPLPELFCLYGTAVFFVLPWCHVNSALDEYVGTWTVFMIVKWPRQKCKFFFLVFRYAEAVDMNGRFQMQGGKNWFLPKEMNANRFFWDSHWLEIWSNHFCPSMGPNGGSVATDSGRMQWSTENVHVMKSVCPILCCTN